MARQRSRRWTGMEFHVRQGADPDFSYLDLMAQTTCNGYRDDICPAKTSMRAMEGETEVRAYKFGKQKNSYSQATVFLHDPVTKETYGVRSAYEDKQLLISSPETIKECGVGYTVSFEVIDINLDLGLYVVKNKPKIGDDGLFSWPCVLRSECCKDTCQGPILKQKQRKQAGDQDCRLHLSIDEACNHVEVDTFRLVGVLLDSAGGRNGGSVATTISPPIKVTADGSGSKGKPRDTIPLHFEPGAKWSGWKELREARENSEEQLQDQPTAAPAVVESYQAHSTSQPESEFLGRGNRPQLLQSQPVQSVRSAFNFVEASPVVEWTMSYTSTEAQLASGGSYFVGETNLPFDMQHHGLARDLGPGAGFNAQGTQYGQMGVAVGSSLQQEDPDGASFTTLPRPNYSSPLPGAAATSSVPSYCAPMRGLEPDLGSPELDTPLQDHRTQNLVPINPEGSSRRRLQGQFCDTHGSQPVLRPNYPNPRWY